MVDIAVAITNSSKLVVRRCEMRDVPLLSDLLKICWHSTYDHMLGENQATSLGRRAYSRFHLGLWISLSLVSRALTVLVASDGRVLVGYALAQRDSLSQIVLYGLYVHPDWKGRGIGSALLDRVLADHADAKSIRLEVLKANTAAVAWYRAKGFEAYGETEHATGTRNVPAFYMDKTVVQA